MLLKLSKPRENRAAKIIASLTLGAASLSRPVLAQTPVSAPVAKPSLEVQISSSVRDGKNYLALDLEQPHLNVVLRNTSDKPLQLFDEWNSEGATSLSLLITAVDGKPLAQPLRVERQISVWKGNAPSLQILSPNQAIVREVYFYVPAALKHPDTPPSPAKIAAEGLTHQRFDYLFFPFPKPFQTRTLTMQAIYEAPNYAKPSFPDAWTGVAQSPPLTYEFRWFYQPH